MVLWRVSPNTDLESACELKKAGRWSWVSRAVLYTSSTPELAVLEALAHWEPDSPPHWLCRIRLPGRASRKSLDRLPPNWRQDKAWSRRLGNRWFDREESAALVVPSALCEEGRNVLVNPKHASARGLRFELVRQFRFDRRLLRLDP